MINIILGINIFVRLKLFERKGDIMKREYSYGSIILIEIILGIVTIGLFFAFGKDNSDSILYSIISSLITWFGSFLIASGLINNRKGSVGDYFNQIHRLDKKAIIVNLIIMALTILITTFLGGEASFFALKDDPKSFMSMGIVGSILTLLLAIFTTYSNHVVSDPRNKDQSITDAFKSVFSVGKKLFGKTILTYLLFVVLPLIVFVGISLLIAYTSKSFETIIGMTFIGMFIFGIFFVVISPIIAARFADNYLDLTGDIEDPIKENENRNEFTISRNV